MELYDPLACLGLEFEPLAGTSYGNKSKRLRCLLFCLAEQKTLARFPRPDASVRKIKWSYMLQTYNLYSAMVAMALIKGFAHSHLATHDCSGSPVHRDQRIADRGGRFEDRPLRWTLRGHKLSQGGNVCRDNSWRACVRDNQPPPVVRPLGGRPPRLEGRVMGLRMEI